MIIKRLNIGTEEVLIKYHPRDWTKSPLVRERNLTGIAKWLVSYDFMGKFTYVSEDAPSWYVDLACLHEEICIGGRYDDILDLPPGDFRRKGVEEFILSIAGEHREEYIRARIDMYEQLLEKKGYAPGMDARMRYALAMLKTMQRWHPLLDQQST